MGLLKMSLVDTVDMMKSDDYKERFKAEYYQTKIRYTKLKKFNHKIEAAYRMPDVIAMPEHDCPIDILQEQEFAMANYLEILEYRAAIEGVEL